MISFHSPSANSPNTVMPLNMVPPSPAVNSFLNLDEKKAQKKRDEEKKKKTLQMYFFIGFSILALTLYSVYFFYPNLMAYIQAPRDLESIQKSIVAKNDAIVELQQKKSLHQAAYKQETEMKVAIIDTVFPPYSKQKIIRDIENAINVLGLLGTFEMNSITLEPPVPKAGSWVTFVSGNFKASQPAFKAFIEDYLGNSGNLEDKNSTITKELNQISVKPVELQASKAASNQEPKEEGVAVSFRLAFYTRPEEK